MKETVLNIKRYQAERSMTKSGTIILYSKMALCFLFVFALLAASAQAAVMPEYTRLQPITKNLKAPTAVALDKYENLYVTESIENKLLIYSQSGQYLKTLHGLSEPLGVAVDQSGRIFIGNKKRGNVEVYDINQNFLFKVGTGDGEFKQPTAIAINKTGDVYVVDSEADLVKVYSPDGSLKFSFGGTGNGNGQFNFPTSISINEISGEVVVADRQLRLSGAEMIHGARIQVFDLNGVFKRSFGEYGIGEGKLSRPVGVIIDEAGRIYVSDSYQQIVRIFDENGIYIGSIYGTENPLRAPLGLVKGKSSRLFIASLNTAGIEVYGLDNYTQMEITPSALSFDGFTNGNNPEVQSIEITNTGNSVLNWSASAQEEWITLTESSGTIAQLENQGMQIGVNLEGLSAGTYSGRVMISAESGAAEMVEITLTVVRPSTPELSFSPVTLQFTSLNGSQPLSQDISIINAGEGILHWTASRDSAWISLSATSGTAPGSIAVSADAATLEQGTYYGAITIDGEGTTSGPRAVSVSLNVIEERGSIKVITNMSSSTFVVNGPDSYAGSGTNWDVDNAPAGTYVIVFGDISGYTRPESQDLTLEKDGSITFTGNYEEAPVDVADQQGYYKQIIVGKGPGAEDRGLVRVYNPDGTETGVEFLAHQYTYGVNVAAGDINCDGYDEIITAPGPGPANPAEISIFDGNGNELTQLRTKVFDYKNGANVTSCDFDRDGHSEVIVGSGSGSPAEVKIFVYDPVQDRLVDSGVNLLAFETNNGVRVTTADIDCDETSELITSSGTGKGNRGVKGWVRIWKVNTEKGIGQWSVSLLKEFPVESRYVNSNGLASGDVNGDYTDEIIVGSGTRYKKSFEIQVLDGEGGTISAFNAGVGDSYGANLASGDLDGDGLAEIVAATGTGAVNEAEVKIFDASGMLKGSFRVFNSERGATVAVGYPGAGE